MEAAFELHSVLGPNPCGQIKYKCDSWCAHFIKMRRKGDWWSTSIGSFILSTARLWMCCDAAAAAAMSGCCHPILTLNWLRQRAKVNFRFRSIEHTLWFMHKAHTKWMRRLSMLNFEFRCDFAKVIPIDPDSIMNMLELPQWLTFRKARNRWTQKVLLSSGFDTPSDPTLRTSSSIVNIGIAHGIYFIHIVSVSAYCQIIFCACLSHRKNSMTWAARTHTQCVIAKVSLHFDHHLFHRNEEMKRRVECKHENA